MRLLQDLAFNEINDPELALWYAEELISLAKAEGNDKYLYSGYLLKGNSQVYQGDQDMVLTAYQQAEQTAIRAGDKLGESRALYSLGFTYAGSGDSEKAEEYLKKSIEVLRDTAVQKKPKSLPVLGEALYNLGDFYINHGMPEKAWAPLEEAGNIFQEVGHISGINYVLGSKGIYYANIGELDLAESAILEAIQLLEADQDYPAIAAFQHSIAEIYRERGDYGRAIHWANQCLDNATRLGIKEQIWKTSLLLAKLDSVTGNYKGAYTHLNRYMQFKDSMDVETVDMTRLERQKAELKNTRLELQQVQLANKLEVQNLKQNRQRTALWAVGASALLLIFIAVGFFGRYRYVRNTNKIISQERDRSEGLLLNILPKETAQELKKNGKVRAKRFEAVTVLFTDFQGFTSHAERLDPEHLVKSLDYYFGHFDTIVEKYGLEKIKTVGDAYMCAGGLPYPDPDHAVKAVEAAFEMLEFVETSKMDNSKDHVGFDIRIGINSGPVVAGVVGTKKFAYDIWGDTVNIASRMEATSHIGRINVAEGTYQLIRDRYDFEDRGKIEVKNRGKLNVYFVLGKKSDSRIA